MQCSRFMFVKEAADHKHKHKPSQHLIALEPTNEIITMTRNLLTYAPKQAKSNTKIKGEHQGKHLDHITGATDPTMIIPKLHKHIQNQ